MQTHPRAARALSQAAHLIFLDNIDFLSADTRVAITSRCKKCTHAHFMYRSTLARENTTFVRRLRHTHTHTHTKGALKFRPREVVLRLFAAGRDAQVIKCNLGAPRNKLMRMLVFVFCCYLLPFLPAIRASVQITAPRKL